MENKIGHYRQHITPGKAKKGGIKNPDIIDKWGTSFYGIKAREHPKQTRPSLELWHIKSMIGRENLYWPLQKQY